MSEDAANARDDQNAERHDDENNCALPNPVSTFWDLPEAIVFEHRHSRIRLLYPNVRMPYLIVSFFLQVFVIHGTPFNFIFIVNSDAHPEFNNFFFIPSLSFASGKNTLWYMHIRE